MEITLHDWKTCVDFLRAELRQPKHFRSTRDGQLIVACNKKLLKRQHRLAELYAKANGTEKPRTPTLPFDSLNCLWLMAENLPVEELRTTQLLPALLVASDSKVKRRQPSPNAVSVNASEPIEVSRKVLQRVSSDAEVALDPEVLLFLTQGLYRLHRRGTTQPKFDALGRQDSYLLNHLGAGLRTIAGNPFILPNPVLVKTLINKSLKKFQPDEIKRAKKWLQ